MRKSEKVYCVEYQGVVKEPCSKFQNLQSKIVGICEKIGDMGVNSWEYEV